MRGEQTRRDETRPWSTSSEMIDGGRGGDKNGKHGRAGEQEQQRCLHRACQERQDQGRARVPQTTRRLACLSLLATVPRLARPRRLPDGALPDARPGAPRLTHRGDQTTRATANHCFESTAGLPSRLLSPESREQPAVCAHLKTLQRFVLRPPPQLSPSPSAPLSARLMRAPSV